MASSKSAPLPADPKHKGTLACVVLKAKNLPNKRSIGKQDPFAVLSIGTEKQKTKPDKRGGQHPTWDEQLHFEIYDDVEDVLSRRREGSGTSIGGGAGGDSSDSASGGTIKAGSQGKASSVASAAPLQKVATAAAAAGGKKILKVACYADDNKEPEFIGEGLVDLTGVLKTGEFDEWVTIRHKDRYCGEVYLELTFFSSGPRPRRVKKAKPATDSAAGTYGGAGTFTSDIDEADFAPNLPNKPDRNAYPAIPSSIRPANGQHRPGMSSSASASVLSTHPTSRTGTAPPLEEVPPALRPSSSLAGIATYTPPYAPPSTHRASSPQPPPVPGMPSSMTMPSMDSHHRSQSFSSSASKPEMHSMYVGPQQPQAQQTNQPYPGGLSHSHSQSLSSSIPSSFSTSSVASVGTIRPSSTQPPAHDPIQDLIRPMSSMSVQHAQAPSGRPMLPPTPSPMPVPSPYQHHQSASAPPPAGHPGPPTPQPYDYNQPSHQTWEQSQHTPVGSRMPSQSYNYGPPSSFSAVAPTPPPQPNSAPPDTHSQYGRTYAYGESSHPLHASQYGQAPPQPPPAEHDYSQSQHQIHPAQMFVPSHGSAPSQQQQPPPPPPARPLSSTSYHALPPVPGSQQGAYRAPSPSPSAHPHPQQASHYQAPPPSGSVINAQSLYDPYSQSYQDPYQQHGRASSPAPPQPTPQPQPGAAAPMSSFSQSSYYSPAQQQPYQSSVPTPSNAPRPLPQTTPQSSSVGLPPSGSGYYHQSTPTPGLPPSPGAPYHQPTSYDHQNSYNAAPPQQTPSPYYHPGQHSQPQQQQPPPPQQYHQPPHGTPLPPSSPNPTPIYQAPPPDQPRYIPSPYDTYAQQQQQQQQQQPQAQGPHHDHSPYGHQPTSYYQ